MEKEKIRELIIGHKERFLGRRDLIRREVQADIAIVPLWKWLLRNGSMGDQKGQPHDL